jgi:predicted permease
MLSDLLYRIRALFRRKSVEGDLDDELRFHLERQIQKHLRAGFTREEAMRRARMDLGGLDQVKEECRQSWGIGLIESLAQDIAYALRVLIKSPGFTAAVALSLALGIGANTAIFSLIDAVMWRMLPVKDPASLWVIDQGLTFQQYKTARDNNQVADLAAYSTVRLNVSVDGSIEPTVDGQLVSGGYFSLLGVNPAIGRTISVDDDRVPNGHPVAMISYGYWKRRFGQESSILGRSISISGTPFTVIGVAPPEFFGMEVGMAPDIFVPVMMQPTAMPAFENLLDNPIIYRTWLTTLARLKPGIGVPQATGALETLRRQALPGGPKSAGNNFPSLVLKPASTGLSSLRKQFSQPLFVLMAVVGVVLLIACANTANLLLARAAARRAEFAMRLALGAGRWRLTRQLLVESIVLAALGGLCGILLAHWAMRLLVVYMSSGRSPIVLDLNPNLRILGFTLAVSVATGILFGLAPALRATRIDLWPALKSLGNLLSRGHGALQPGKILAVAQVALSLLLLIGAGLFVRSLQKLNGENFGVSRESVLIVRVEPKGSDQRNIPGTTARLDRIYQGLLEAVRAIPGVRMASLGQSTPTTPNPGAAGAITLPSGATVRVPMVMLYPDYFAAVGVPMAAGREFNSTDLRESSPLVCVVNETFARQMFPGENAIGKSCTTSHRQNFNDPTRPRYSDLEEPVQIVGVVKDSRYSNPRGEAQPVIYMTFLQTPTGRGQMVLHVRVAGDASSVLPRIREEVLRVDPTLPMFEVHTLAQEMDAALVQERLIAMLSSLFGVLALLLASVGLYGLLAFGVVQRTGEMGIRMALGAGRADVVWMILKEALLLVLAGVVVGIPVALGVTRLAGSQISGLLFGVKATDPFTIATAAVLLISVATMAAFLPARRASQVDPMVALRNE